MFGGLIVLADVTVAVRDVSSEEDRFQLDSKLNAVASSEAASMLRAMMTETIFHAKTRHPQPPNESHQSPKPSPNPGEPHEPLLRAGRSL